MEQLTNLIDKRYRQTDPNSNFGVTTAAGKGIPLGIGYVNIGWYDDDDHKFHAFVLPNMFHILESPVSVLGITFFLKVLGYYQSGGTTITFS